MKNLVCDLQMAMVEIEEKKKTLTARLKDGVKQLDLNLTKLRKIDKRCTELQGTLERMIKENNLKNGHQDNQPRKTTKPATAKQPIAVLAKRGPKKM